MEYDGKEWNYIGGKSGCSSVPITNLSIEALKRHLHDYMAISDEDLEETTLSWRLIEKERNLNFMCSLVDTTNVINMVRHVNRVADGYVDIFAVSPERTAFASSDEEGGFEEQGAVTKEQKEAQQVQHERQLEFLQIKLEHAHQVEYEQAEGRQIEQLDQQLLNQIVPNVARKMPVVRAPMNLQDKSKGIQIESAHEGEDAEDKSDSDYENVHEADRGDSSADDDEAIFYRKYVEELKESVRRQMLGEDRAKVKEEFIVPENIKEEQEEGSECFDIDDDLSFDEDSDGEVRTRKTKHRVYDESAQESSSTSQQQPQERHVLYYEKPTRPRKKATPQPVPATEPVHAPHQASAQHKVPAHRQSATASHMPSASRPFIPPKQKQVPSSSQPSSQASASHSSSQPSSPVARRETIPMSDVVTQAVPKEGRLKWYFWGNQNGGARGEGED
ncbi:hypothetical protein ACQ4PT_004987 [Festuca glaucescens]